MFYTVYKITNNINQRFYIGKHQTNNINDNYFGSGKLIKQAIKKYGIENFTKEILFVFDNEYEMNQKESELVKITAESYNLCSGGKGGFSYINRMGLGGFKGKKHTPESIKKWHDTVEANGGLKVSDETRKKISDANKLTNSSRGEKVSAALTGRKKSEEHKKKIAEAIRKKHNKYVST